VKFPPEEVDVTHPQPEQFALAQPGAGDEDHGGVQTLRDRLGEGVDLSRLQGYYDLLRNFREVST
jgi:hypothetical protein